MPRPLPCLLLATAAVVGLSGCGGQRATRPLVMAHPGQMGDLYWNGAIDDSQGNRWNVDIVPGIAPTARIVGDSWERAGGYIADTGKREHGEEGLVRQAYRFAGRDVVRDFMVHGVRDDYVSTSQQLGALWTDMPFGWPAQWIGRTVWGYGLKPAGRLVGGTITGTGAFALGTVAGALEGTGRTALAVGDVVAIGTVYPAARLAWHQPAWLFSIINREPDLKQDGHWGLHVVRRAAPPQPAPETAPAPEAIPETAKMSG